MRGVGGGLVMAALLGLLLGAPAHAGIAKIKGLHNDHERIKPLIKAPVTVVETPGEVFAVIGGDYGFALYDGSGAEVAEFEDSQEAVGLKLAPGDYKVIPSIDDDVHHHQFIEILVKTD
jgi:hypothetical protein